MSTQQDIYAASSENHPPMLNKDNYVPWSSRLLRYAKSDPDREVPVAKTFHEQTDDELTEKEVKQMEADDQAIQIILMGLPEDIYAAIDSCETAQEIWLRVQHMMKGSDIGIQDKKAKLFNEWERFTSTDGESIESYYHRFSKLMNDFKRNKHFPEKIASNLKFLNNLQPEWRRHVTIVHQTKDLHEVDYTQLFDFLKYIQAENVGNKNGLIFVLGIANSNANQIRNGNVVAARAKDLNEIEEVNVNCILMANLQQASTSGTQIDKAPIYDSNGSAEKFLGTVCFGNDHVASIMGYGDLQWGNILITEVYFVEALGHNLFSVRQFYDSDLEVAFRRNNYFVKNLEGVDFLIGNHTTNLYTINLHEMASASSICIMARATSTKSWLWHQRLSHLNFDTINDLVKNDLVTGLPKFKYYKENLCPSWALCYPKNDYEDIGKHGAKGDIGFFIGYFATYCAYRVYNRQTKKIMETMNVLFNELLAMAFEQRSSKLGLQSMTSG
ncbi:retrovirus-related pol polyprotein from transposon TNT 1-94 [Tanacetum coccineum]